MELRSLGAGFGAETTAFDAPFGEIWDAFFKAQVLVFRGLKLTAEQFLAFGRRFGRPEPHVIDQFHHPKHADILVLSNVVKDGKPAGLADAGTYFQFGQTSRRTQPWLPVRSRSSARYCKSSSLPPM